MRLIVDANIIFSALMRDSTTRRILLLPQFELYVPEYVKVEIEGHLPELVKRSGLKEEDLRKALDIVFSNITFIGLEGLEEEIRGAYDIMKDIDEDDTPYLALYLAIRNDGIWTQDPHFQMVRKVEVWSTLDLLVLVDDLFPS